MVVQDNGKPAVVGPMSANGAQSSKHREFVPITVGRDFSRFVFAPAYGFNLIVTATKFALVPICPPDLLP